MDQFPTDELRALRARAYGPDADIHDDPGALRRLQELESLLRTADAPDPAAAAEAAAPPPAGAPAPSPPAPDSRRPEQPASPGVTTPASAAETSPSSPAPAPRRPRRRLALVWALTLVVAGLSGAAVATLVAPKDPAPIITLPASEQGTWPEFILGPRPEGAVLFTEHLGVQLVAAPQQTDVGSTMCLYALSADDPARGAFAVGCDAGPFASTLTSVVTVDWPAELRELYPEGSAVRYVLEGDRVLVYAAPADGAP